MDKPETIRIQLTDEQKEQVKAATGRDVQAIELTSQELEQRVAPFLYSGNSNETLLT